MTKELEDLEVVIIDIEDDEDSGSFKTAIIHEGEPLPFGFYFPKKVLMVWQES